MKNKTKFCSQKNSQNCFFLLEPVRCHFMTKFWSDLAHVSILDPKQFQNFLIFLNLLFIRQIFLFFYHELLECRKRTKFSSHLAYASIFDPKKFQNFLNFFYFFVEFTVHRAVLLRSKPLNVLKIWFRTKLIRF